MTAKGQDPVKAIVQDRFGPPDVLRLSDTGLPEAGPDDVLVRVHAAALNPADWHIVRGDPLVARLMGVGLTRPKARVAGIDAAGVVEAAGANVRGLANGDDVLGFFRGAFAEYACAAADLVVPKPAGLTFEQAAAVPIAATTALRGIRDTGEVTAGQRVLVNGAGGGVGSLDGARQGEGGREGEQSFHGLSPQGERAKGRKVLSPPTLLSHRADGSRALAPALPPLQPAPVLHRFGYVALEDFNLIIDVTGYFQ